MTAVYFVDTNILLYAASKDATQAAKAAVASAVLQEFYVQATRARPHALAHDQASALIRSWLRFPVQENTRALLLRALDTAQRYQVSFWDASIIEAARALGCQTFLTEDLNDGQDYGGVRVMNPFVHPME